MHNGFKKNFGFLKNVIIFAVIKPIELYGTEFVKPHPSLSFNL